MAMSVGSVSIDEETGEASGSGCAKEIFDELDDTIDYGDVEGEILAAARQQVADMCNAIATGVINHIANNAEVSVTVSNVQEGEDEADGSGTIE